MAALTEAMRQALAAARVGVHTFPSEWTVLTMSAEDCSNSKKTLGEWVDLERDPRSGYYTDIISAAVPSLKTLGSHPMVIPAHQTIILGSNLQIRTMINRIFYTALAQCTIGQEDCPMTPAPQAANDPGEARSPATSTETGESIPFLPPTPLILPLPLPRTPGHPITFHTRRGSILLSPNAMLGYDVTSIDPLAMTEADERAPTREEVIALNATCTPGTPLVWPIAHLYLRVVGRSADNILDVVSALCDHFGLTTYQQLEVCSAPRYGHGMANALDTGLLWTHHHLPRG